MAVKETTLIPSMSIISRRNLWLRLERGQGLEEGGRKYSIDTPYGHVLLSLFFPRDVHET